MQSYKMPNLKCLTPINRKTASRDKRSQNRIQGQRTAEPYLNPLSMSTDEKRGFIMPEDTRNRPQRLEDVQRGFREIHRDKEKPERRLRPKNCSEG